MLEKIISLDKQLLVFLNSFGSKAFDPFWLIITKQSNWTPFFLILLFLIYKKFGTKQTFILLLFVTILLIINNNLTEIVKFYFERLRPCTDLDIKNIIRNVKPSATFSFYSGHASNSSATMIFLFLIFKKYYKHFWLVFIFPLVFAYSRIYLGLHFPIDILTGFAIGSTMGFLFYKMYQLIQKKYFNTVS
jgi:undecaprenyl-diphosphatase